MLDNNVPDWALFTVASIRETREQVNKNTRRIEAIEQRLAALEPQPEPVPEPEPAPNNGGGDDNESADH